MTKTRGAVLGIPSLLIVILALVGFFVIHQDHAEAASLSSWDPGHIIDDSVFTNYESMEVGQIQQFLNSKVANCDTAGTQIATDFGSSLTHAQYAASRGWSAPPYTCLKDYTENGLSSAQIIYNAAQQYQINPQVLIVLLQKEQGLVTDSWPLATEYRSATGYGCPDASVCDTQYYGFTNQVNNAAKMYHAILTNNPNWSTPVPLGNWPIQYKPNSNCGSPVVNIQNRSTQALYNYTPYQPNQAALDAGYGAGDSCSSYGNRNFYLYFTDWFGSTYAPSYAWKQVDKEIYTDDSLTQNISEGQIQRNQRFYVVIKALNTGNATWNRGTFGQQVNVGTSNSMDRASAFCDANWMGNNCNRPATTSEASVAPGQVGTFGFWMTAPSKLGTYNEYFNLVMDGTSWLQDIGFYWHFTVSDNNAPATISQLTTQSGQNELLRGDYLVSPNGKNTFIMQRGGYGELLTNMQSKWLLAAQGKVAQKLVLQLDGNLVMYDGSGNPIWASGTSTATRLSLDDDGNLVLYDAANTALWSSGTSQASISSVSGFTPNSVLYRGQQLQSADGRYTIALQKDGNLVIYSPTRAIWASNTTDGYLLAQQADGNLVLYNNRGNAVWANSRLTPGSTTYIQVDGNFVTYTTSGQPIWASGSGGWLQ